MTINELLEQAVTDKASDLFLVAGRPASVRISGKMCSMNDIRLMPNDTYELIREIYEIARRDMSSFEKTGDDDFAFALPGLSRFRISAYRQRGSCSAVIRIITFTVPDSRELGIPDNIMEFANLRKGLVLVTGSAGSGKSTTLACIVDRINKTQEKHIITLEDPLEFLHKHDRSIISQREIDVDTESYVKALRAALRQSPDVILLGEMRDYETINVAMTAAETGHLLFSTLHTIGAVNTIDRIIDVFPANQQRQIATQLSMVLNAIVSQQLVPDVNGTPIPVFEIMTVTTAIRNMIRENKVVQIEGQLYSSFRPDMISMDQSLLKLYRDKRITRETALHYATNPEFLEKKLI